MSAGEAQAFVLRVARLDERGCPLPATERTYVVPGALLDPATPIHDELVRELAAKTRQKGDTDR